jgi:hypothetical protein
LSPRYSILKLVARRLLQIKGLYKLFYGEMRGVGRSIIRRIRKGNGKVNSLIEI